jgi:hypothetical protein
VQVTAEQVQRDVQRDQPTAVVLDRIAQLAAVG